MSYALRVNRSTMSLVRLSILNFCKSGKKVMDVKSSFLASVMVGSLVFPMLSIHVYQKSNWKNNFNKSTLTPLNEAFFKSMTENLTCLKALWYSLQDVSTMNFVLKMLHNFAPYPFLPPVQIHNSQKIIVGQHQFWWTNKTPLNCKKKKKIMHIWNKLCWLSS